MQNSQTTFDVQEVAVNVQRCSDQLLCYITVRLGDDEAFLQLPLDIEDNPSDSTPSEIVRYVPYCDLLGRRVLFSDVHAPLHIELFNDKGVVAATGCLREWWNLSFEDGVAEKEITVVALGNMPIGYARLCVFLFRPKDGVEAQSRKAAPVPPSAHLKLPQARMAPKHDDLMVRASVAFFSDAMRTTTRPETAPKRISDSFDSAISNSAKEAQNMRSTISSCAPFPPSYNPASLPSVYQSSGALPLRVPPLRSDSTAGERSLTAPKTATVCSNEGLQGRHEHSLPRSTAEPQSFLMSKRPCNSEPPPMAMPSMGFLNDPPIAGPMVKPMAVPLSQISLHRAMLTYTSQRKGRLGFRKKSSAKGATGRAKSAPWVMPVVEDPFEGWRVKLLEYFALQQSAEESAQALGYQGEANMLDLVFQAPSLQSLARRH